METFDSKSFSHDLKTEKFNYLNKKEIRLDLIQKHLKSLEHFDLGHLKNENQKKAFWINVYNGMTNYFIIHLKLKSSMKEIPNLFKSYHLNVGGLRFSLDDIEHGLLRRNGRPLVGENDSRFNLLLEKLDYRIHFALNCGAKSCPPIAFYSAEQIEVQLTLAEESFVAQEFIVNDLEKVIECSALFTIYQNDFEGVFLNDKKYQNYTIKLRQYDWSI